jgi:hypothetical protein
MRVNPAIDFSQRLKLWLVNGLLWFLKGSGVLDNGGERTGYGAFSHALWLLLDEGTCSSLPPQPFPGAYHCSTIFKQTHPPNVPDTRSITSTPTARRTTTNLTKTPTEVHGTTIATSEGKITTPSSNGTHLQFCKGEAFDRARRLLSNKFMLRPWEERGEVPEADVESSS